MGIRILFNRSILKKKSPEGSRGTNCFHNGIILIVNCFQNCTAMIQKKFYISNEKNRKLVHFLFITFRK
jgi:hypothetical protein